MPKKQKTKEFKAYPSRTITLSDEAWEILKSAKLAHGGNWDRFIKAQKWTTLHASKKSL